MASEGWENRYVIETARAAGVKRFAHFIVSFHLPQKKTILRQKLSEVMDNSEVTCEKGMLNTVPHTL